MLIPRYRDVHWDQITKAKQKRKHRNGIFDLFRLMATNYKMKKKPKSTNPTEKATERDETKEKSVMNFGIFIEPYVAATPVHSSFQHQTMHAETNKQIIIIENDRRRVLRCGFVCVCTVLYCHLWQSENSAMQQWQQHQHQAINLRYL